MQQIVVYITILSLVYTASAIECKSCAYTHTDNQHLGEVARALMEDSGVDQSDGEQCANDPGSVISFVCVEAKTCRSLKVTAKFQSEGNSTSILHYLRTCGNVGDKVGCKDLDEYQDIFKNKLSSFNGTVEEFEGAECHCNKNECNTQEPKSLSTATAPSLAAVLIPVLATLKLLFFG